MPSREAAFGDGLDRDAFAFGEAKGEGNAFTAGVKAEGRYSWEQPGPGEPIGDAFEQFVDLTVSRLDALALDGRLHDRQRAGSGAGFHTSATPRRDQGS